MARSFAQYPFGAFQGQLSGQPFNSDNRTLGTVVRAAIVWPNYFVGIEPLGDANPNFNVQVNMQALASQIVSLRWQIQSVYIDNEGVDFPVYVYFPDTQCAISCPPNASGWYAVYTRSNIAWLIGLGISTFDIINGVMTNVFFTDVRMTPYLDQEIQTAVQQGISSPQINLGGSGGQILSISILQNSVWLTAGGMSIAGGGGSGGASHIATLNSLGQITSPIVVDTPGADYTSTPLITANGPYNPPPAWQSNIRYAANTLVGYNGFAFESIQIVPQNVPPPNPTYWSSLGVSSQAIAPIFGATLSPITGGVSFTNNSTFGDRALGDQIASSVEQIAGVGDFADNLFNTPYNTGFLYLTNVHIVQLIGTGNDQFTLQSAAGAVVFDVQSASGPETLIDLQGCNLKLPANIEYRLHATGHAGGPNTYAFNFAWTYSQTNR